MRFREIRALGVTFVTQSWVVERVKRSRTFVVKYWHGDPYAADMKTAPIGSGGRTFSDQSRDLIQEHTGKQKPSV